MINKKHLYAGIFVGFALLIFYSLHYFVLDFLNKQYDLFLNPVLWSMILVGILVIEVFFAHRFFNIFGRFVYYLFGIHFGLLWIFFSVTLVFRVLDSFFDVSMFLLPTFGAIAIYSLVNVWFVNVNKIKITKGKKLRIVHLSDLHLGPILREDFLENIVNKVNSLNPDMVCITGDIIEDAGWFTELKTFDKIKSPVYAVLGNHDMHSTVNEKLDLLKATKVKVLRNENEVCCGVNIIGIDELIPFRWRVKRVLNRAYDKEKLNILLTHEPITFRLIKNYPIDLQLAGHTHGGQIFPFSFVIRLFYPVYKGLYQKNGQYIHVSQGTGFWGPPMRLLTKNEITLIDVD